MGRAAGCLALMLPAGLGLLAGAIAINYLHGYWAFLIGVGVFLSSQLVLIRMVFRFYVPPTVEDSWNLLARRYAVPIPVIRDEDGIHGYTTVDRTRRYVSLVVPRRDGLVVHLDGVDTVLDQNRIMLPWTDISQMRLVSWQVRGRWQRSVEIHLSDAALPCLLVPWDDAWAGRIPAHIGVQ